MAQKKPDSQGVSQATRLGEGGEGLAAVGVHGGGQDEELALEVDLVFPSYQISAFVQMSMEVG